MNDQRPENLSEDEAEAMYVLGRRYLTKFRWRQKKNPESYLSPYDESAREELGLTFGEVDGDRTLRRDRVQALARKQRLEIIFPGEEGEYARLTYLGISEAIADAKAAEAQKDEATTEVAAAPGVESSTDPERPGERITVTIAGQEVARLRAELEALRAKQGELEAQHTEKVVRAILQVNKDWIESILGSVGQLVSGMGDRL